MPLCSCCLVIVTNNLDLMPASASHQPQKEGTLSDWLRPGSTTGVLRPSTEIYVHETTNYQAGADDLTAVPTPLVHVFLARDVSIGCVVSAFTFGMDSELQLIVRRSENAQVLSCVDVGVCGRCFLLLRAGPIIRPFCRQESTGLSAVTALLERLRMGMEASEEADFARRQCCSWTKGLA